MQEIFKLKQGDTSPALRYALLPETVDLTGASVRFQMRFRRGVIVIDEDAGIESVSPPIVRHSWAEGSTDMPGIYEAEFKVTYADDSTETFPNDGFISVVIQGDVR